MRGNPELERWGRESLRGARATFVGSEHIRTVLAEVCGTVERVHEVPPGVDVEVWVPEARETALSALLAEARRDPPNPGGARSACRTTGNAARLDAFLAGDRPTVVYFGKLIEQKGVDVLLDALAGLDARVVVVGFGARARAARGAGGAGPASRRCSPARSSTGTCATCSRSRTRASCRRSSRRRSAWSPRRRPPPAARRSSRATRASPRSRPGWSGRCQPALARLVGVPAGDAEALRARLAALLALPDGDRALLRATVRRVAEERWSWAGVAERLLQRAAGVRLTSDAAGPSLSKRKRKRLAFADMHPSDNAPPRAAPRRGARALRGGGRLHRRGRGGVRAARPRDARARQPLRGGAGGGARHGVSSRNLVGELIASEVEVRTGRCSRRSAEVPRGARGAARAAGGARRAARPRARRDRDAPVGRAGSDQRIIDTPHYRRNDEILQYVVWRNNTFGMHVHVGIRGADRAVAVDERAAQLAARAARALGELAVPRGRRHGAPLRPHADLHALLPPLRRARRARTWDELRGLRPVPLRDRVDRRAHAALVERAPAPRLPDRRDADLRRAARPRRGAAPRRADGLASTARCARALDEGEPLPEHPHRLIEENLWRAIRYGLSGELIDLERGDVGPGARAARAAARVGAPGGRRDRRDAVAARSRSGTPPSGRSSRARRGARASFEEHLPRRSAEVGELRPRPRARRRPARPGADRRLLDCDAGPLEARSGLATAG